MNTIDADRDLREAIGAFLIARGDEQLPLMLRETLCLVDERLEAESVRLLLERTS